MNDPSRGADGEGAEPPFRQPDLRGTMERLRMEAVREPSEPVAQQPVESRGEYALSDLTWLEGDEFVRQAYRRILQRDADPGGLEYWAGMLRDGKIDKIELLHKLMSTNEARARGVRIRGLIRMESDGRERLSQHRPEGGELDARDLLDLDDDEFVATAYEALLRRPPSVQEAATLLAPLRGGEMEKIDILGSLQRSPEGRAAGVPIRGVRWRYWLARASRFRWVGPAASFIRHLVELPDLGRTARRLEAALRAERRERERTLREVEREFDWLLRHAAGLDALRAALAKRDAGIEKFRAFVLAELEQERERIRESNAVMGRLAGELAEAKTDLADTREKLHARCDDSLLPDETYLALEERFRGSAEEITSRARRYVREIRDAGAGTTNRPVLDIGSGRGEWLSLLAGEGLVARGVDSNLMVVEQTRARGLDVRHADAFEFLATVEAGALGAVTAFHVVEHLSARRVIALIDECLRALAPGGLLMFETPNPENLVVGACNFYYDPTHVRPLPPELLQFLVQARGFEQVEIRRLGDPAAAVPRAFPPGDPNEAFNPFIHALRHNFFSPPDYAIIAHKSTATGGPRKAEERGR